MKRRLYQEKHMVDVVYNFILEFRPDLIYTMIAARFLYILGPALLA